MRSMQSARRQITRPLLRLTDRQVDELCDRLDEAAVAFDYTPEQLAKLQSLCLPELFVADSEVEPTWRQPGDFRKVEEMRQRADAGRTLFGDQDAPADDSRKLATSFM